MLTWHFLSFKIVSLLIITIYSLPMTRLADFPVINELAIKGWWILYVIVGVSIPLGWRYARTRSQQLLQTYNQKRD